MGKQLSPLSRAQARTQRVGFRKCGAAPKRRLCAEGKTPILTSAGAHILVDDREDICKEAEQTGLHAIPVYKSSILLSWWPQLESYVRERGVDWIIRNHSPVPLRPNQFFKTRK